MPSLVEQYEAHVRLWPPEMRALFHRLWTKAVGTEQYDKEEWKTLEKLIEALLVEKGR